MKVSNSQSEFKRIHKIYILVLWTICKHPPQGWQQLRKKSFVCELCDKTTSSCHEKLTSWQVDTKLINLKRSLNVWSWLKTRLLLSYNETVAKKIRGAITMDLYLSIQATLIYWQKNAEVVDFTSRWCKSIFLVKFSRFFFYLWNGQTPDAVWTVRDQLIHISLV